MLIHALKISSFHIVCTWFLYLWYDHNSQTKGHKQLLGLFSPNPPNPLPTIQPIQPSHHPTVPPAVGAMDDPRSSMATPPLEFGHYELKNELGHGASGRVCLGDCLFGCLFVCLFGWLVVCLFVCLVGCLFVCFFLSFFLCLFVCLLLLLLQLLQNTKQKTTQQKGLGFPLKKSRDLVRCDPMVEDVKIRWAKETSWNVPRVSQGCERYTNKAAVVSGLSMGISKVQVLFDTLGVIYV